MFFKSKASLFWSLISECEWSQWCGLTCLLANITDNLLLSNIGDIQRLAGSHLLHQLCTTTSPVLTAETAGWWWEEVEEEEESEVIMQKSFFPAQWWWEEQSPVSQPPLPPPLLTSVGLSAQWRTVITYHSRLTSQITSQIISHHITNHITVIPISCDVTLFWW